MNPNAGSFNPFASSFQPGGGFGGQVPPFQPTQQQQQQQQGGYAPRGAYGQIPQAGFDPFAAYQQQYAQSQPQPQPQPQPGQYYPQQQGFQPRAPQQQGPPASWEEQAAPGVPHPEQVPAKPAPGGKVGISLPPPSGAGKSVSLSIGGSKPAAPKSATPPAQTANNNNNKAAAPPAEATKDNSAASASASAPAPAKKEGSAATTAPASAAAKKEAKASERAAQAEAQTTADSIAKEAAQVADQEALDDLYGKDAGHEKMHVNLVFIGHVDAGKSTMGGNLLYLSGMVDQRTMEKYERESKAAGRETWALSWALDSTMQERDKGITVEVGRAFFETQTRRYTILDAPGHKNFVPNMISGAAQADIAILVISARKGEFETGFEKGGQTREHAMLVRTAGVQRLIVVINKMDDPTVQWDKARYDEIVGKMTPFIKSAGFSSKMVSYVPVSAFTGANLKEVVKPDVCPWNETKPLLSLLDTIPLSDRDVHAPLVMPVSEKYRDMGTIVVGKVEAGRLRQGSKLMLMPNRNSVEVQAVFNEMEDEVPSAIAGDNVRVRIRGVEEDDVSVGFVLCEARKPVHSVTQFQAQLAILESKNIICAGYSAVMHIHTMSEEVTLTALLHYYDKKTGKKSRKPPQFAKKGQKVVALIEAAAPVCVEKFERLQALGRFTLRDEGRTIAIGKVTKLIEKTDEEAQNKQDMNQQAASAAL